MISLDFLVFSCYITKEGNNSLTFSIIYSTKTGLRLTIVLWTGLWAPVLQHFLKLIYNLASGYNYLNNSHIDKLNPLSGQLSGVSFWKEVIGEVAKKQIVLTRVDLWWKNGIWKFHTKKYHFVDYFSAFRWSFLGVPRNNISKLLTILYEVQESRIWLWVRERERE